jgi:hypothetical protein
MVYVMKSRHMLETPPRGFNWISWGKESVVTGMGYWVPTPIYWVWHWALGVRIKYHRARIIYKYRIKPAINDILA